MPGMSPHWVQRTEYILAAIAHMKEIPSQVGCKTLFLNDHLRASRSKATEHRESTSTSYLTAARMKHHDQSSS